MFVFMYGYVCVRVCVCIRQRLHREALQEIIKERKAIREKVEQGFVSVQHVNDESP